MPPNGEAAQGVGGDLDRQNTGKAEGGASQSDGADAAGTQIRDHQKGHKEDQRRAEIVHDSQTAANSQSIDNKQDQIALSQDPIHGRRSDKHEADLAQLGRLQG